MAKNLPSQKVASSHAAALQKPSASTHKGAKIASAGNTKPPAIAAQKNKIRKTPEAQPTDSAPIRLSVNGTKMVAVDNTTYVPSEQEGFMNDRQKDFFRRKLLSWKEEILRESKETLTSLQTENENHPDIADRASSETDRAIELRARDRQRKLISKIDSALARIEDGSYGYCEETGEPISLKRLDARPIATLSIEAQERHERRERVYRDD